MLIDEILDYKDGYIEYNPERFYSYIQFYSLLDKELKDEILDAMEKENIDGVKRGLSKYIINYDYNLDIIEFINNYKWL